MPIPLLAALAVAGLLVGTTVVVVVSYLSLEKILEWFQSRRPSWPRS